MTHKDIYTKFMIEYDKANVTSSYPSLTEYEVATVLDKAYNALIAQKVTGNNVRRAGFEADVKAVSDLAPLVVHEHKNFYNDGHMPATNVVAFKIPDKFLYFVQGYLNYRVKGPNGENLLESQVYSPDDFEFEDYDNDFWVKYKDVYHNAEDVNDLAHSDDPTTSTTKGIPYDNKTIRLVPVKLVPHNVAERFFTTSYNLPWVKIPVCYMEDDSMYVVYDLINPPMVDVDDHIHLVYIKSPNTFVKDLSKYDEQYDLSYFDCPDAASDDTKKDYEFECSPTVAEELISLAVSFALENVESQRLNTKLNMRGLEA